MVKGNQKNIWIIAFAVFISIFFSSISYASTYKWEDFTEPFKQKFELEEGQNITIEIDLPDTSTISIDIVPLSLEAEKSTDIISGTEKKMMFSICISMERV